MSITVSDIVVWLIVGALAGYLVGMLVKRRKGGFGPLANLGIGMVGAIIGGFLFDILKIGVSLQAVSVNLQDILAAVAGSLIFLGVLWLVRRKIRKPSSA